MFLSEYCSIVYMFSLIRSSLMKRARGSLIPEYCLKMLANLLNVARHRVIDDKLITHVAEEEISDMSKQEDIVIELAAV